MVQIEELGKMIAQMMFNRQEGDGRGENPELARTALKSLKLSRETLLDSPMDALRQRLDEEDGAGLYRMELAAKILMEWGYVETDAPGTLFRKAKEILEYVQLADSTFSLERVALLSEIDAWLDGEC